MPLIAVFHPNAQLRALLKRGVDRPELRVITCRTTRRVEHLVRTDLVDAMVADVKRSNPEWFFGLMERFPTIPSFPFSLFKPDDGRLLTRCLDAGVAGLMVEGVDDVVAGEVVSHLSIGATLAASIADAPRRLRLREPIQLEVWEEVVKRVGSRVKTSDIAESINVTREHLSREFGSGGAPNLKRVIDLARLMRAAILLRNPGHSVSDVAKILKFASASHLSGSAKRLTDYTPRRLADIGPRGILGRFLRGKTRSRL